MKEFKLKTSYNKYETLYLSTEFFYFQYEKNNFSAK